MQLNQLMLQKKMPTEFLVQTVRRRNLMITISIMILEIRQLTIQVVMTPMALNIFQFIMEVVDMEAVDMEVAEKMDIQRDQVRKFSFKFFFSF